MFFVIHQGVVDVEELFYRVADSVQTTVSIGIDNGLFFTVQNSNFCHDAVR